MNIALGVSRCGMPLGYEVFCRQPHRRDDAGGDCWSDGGALWEGQSDLGADRGMISEDNIEFLKQEARRYGAEVFIVFRSAQRTAKERAMHNRFEKRIEEALKKIAEGCRKRRQKPIATAQRVGRLLTRNTRAAGPFEVHIEAAADGLARFQWQKVEQWRDWARLSEGCYLLRSYVTDTSWPAFSLTCCGRSWPRRAAPRDSGMSRARFSRNSRRWRSWRSRCQPARG